MRQGNLAQGKQSPKMTVSATSSSVLPADTEQGPVPRGWGSHGETLTRSMVPGSVTGRVGVQECLWNDQFRMATCFVRWKEVQRTERKDNELGYEGFHLSSSLVIRAVYSSFSWVKPFNEEAKLSILLPNTLYKICQRRVGKESN